MNAPAIRSLLLSLCLVFLAPADASYRDDNPFVEAMLRMMAIMGMIDRYPLSAGIPYAAAYPGLGMTPGIPWTGMAGTTLPGMQPFGAAGWPGGLPGAGGMPGAGWYGSRGRTTSVADLDGIWELTNGRFVMIRGRIARLYVNRDRWQDFTIGYDGRIFWWSPRGSNVTTHYRYQMRDGRMVLRDIDGKVLLMRRRN